MKGGAGEEMYCKYKEERIWIEVKEDWGMKEGRKEGGRRKKRVKEGRKENRGIP